MSPGTVASSLIAWFLLVTIASAETTEVRDALVRFMAHLTVGNRASLRGWNSSSDPCLDLWTGVVCDSRSSSSVTKILLDGLKLLGPLDASSVCMAGSLKVLSLSNNDFTGWLPEEISNCSNLTHLYLNGNILIGALPSSFSRCSKLKRLDLSHNYFSGQLPDTSNMHGIVSFLAEHNKFSGSIPDFSFANLNEFNVSNNYSCWWNLFWCKQLLRQSTTLWAAAVEFMFSSSSGSGPALLKPFSCEFFQK